MKLPIQQLSELVKKAKSEPTAEDLMKRPCCGSGCVNCPYFPKHKKGNTNVREELKKESSTINKNHIFLVLPELHKQAEDSQIKNDHEINITTNPNKTPRSGFIHDPKTNRLMVQDRRFNLVQPKEEIIKRAQWIQPDFVRRMLAKVKQTKTPKAKNIKDQKELFEAMEMRKVQQHLRHPDTKHFLSILDKENNAF